MVDLDGLSYRELQRLAKEHGVRANLSRTQMQPLVAQAMEALSRGPSPAPGAEAGLFREAMSTPKTVSKPGHVSQFPSGFGTNAYGPHPKMGPNPAMGPKPAMGPWPTMGPFPEEGYDREAVRKAQAQAKRKAARAKVLGKTGKVLKGAGKVAGKGLMGLGYLGAAWTGWEVGRRIYDQAVGGDPMPRYSEEELLQMGSRDARAGMLGLQRQNRRDFVDAVQGLNAVQDLELELSELIGNRKPAVSQVAAKHSPVAKTMIQLDMI